MSILFQNRVDLTSSCADCNALPKVEHAGSIVEGNPSYQLMHNGIKVMLGGYHGQWMQKIIWNLKGHHEPQEEKAFHEILSFIPADGVMIELGSYWAYYSMWFQHVVPNSKNYMVEPIKEKLHVGKRNFELNNMHGHFINASVGSKYLKDNQFVDWDESKLKVDQITIDELININKISHVSILHSDIQGAELEMLSGAKQALSENIIDYIFISTHGYCHKKCVKKLKDYGYDIICNHTINESYSADGLIVAKSSLKEKPKNIKISRLNVPLSKKILTNTKEMIHALRSGLF